MAAPMTKGTKQKPEKWVKDRVKAILKSYGDSLWWYMPQGQYYGTNGIPDFIACADGKFLAIETKTDYGVVRPNQQLQIDKIKKAGGYAIVVRESTLDQFEVFMTKVMDR